VPRETVDPISIVPSILKRELGIQNESGILRIEKLNTKGWPINSSFNNQLLFGFVAILKDDVELDDIFHHNNTSYLVSSQDDINRLLSGDLTCLQCRSVLMEWLLSSLSMARQDSFRKT
jgi:hypothetical protein